MGKASKRRGTRQTTTTGGMPSPAPFARRPFAGLSGETEWVALREILPAATATVSFADGAGPGDIPRTATLATVLPMAWPGLHRTGGDVLVATQAGATCGDASRDIAAAWLLTAAAPEGMPVTRVPTPTAETPRLQDLLDPAAAFTATLHEGFGFWVGQDTELDESGQASLEAANESIVPTERVVPDASVFWVRFGERSFIRWVLPQDEDRATDGLARLAAAGRERLTPESRLLGAFRACGLLVPVWEVDDAPAESFAAAVAGLQGQLAEAIGATAALTVEERRARNGLLSRQVTLR